ncbi:hypothetical protein OIU76_023847 [Salix suchowensis]|nr:hypothetical protein OIU76_023847 [Salix suchowensis]
MTVTNGKVPSVTSNGGLTNDKPFKIFVGYDPSEDIAYEVCCHSILKRSSIPVEITPIVQSELRTNGLYWRERGKLESTEFSFTRFLTPHLANYDGWAMFVDCDFLYLADIKELRDLIDDKFAIMCVQHDYAPKRDHKNGWGGANCVSEEELVFHGAVQLWASEEQGAHARGCKHPNWCFPP